MSAIDRVVEANRRYAEGFDQGGLPGRPPSLRLAVLRLERETGKSPVVPARFLAFTDLQQNVRDQIRKVRSHPWLPETISVRGFIYDVDTGLLSEVDA